MSSLKRVRLSTRSQHLFGQLKHKTGLPINILSRFALSLSLNDTSIPNPDLYDENGIELTPYVLFGEYEDLFVTIMLTRLRSDKLNSTLYMDRMIRAHINRGASSLFQRIKSLTDFYQLLQVEKK